MAHISPRGLKRLGQIRRPGRAFFEKYRRQNHRFEECKALFREDGIERCFGFPGSFAGLKDWTLP